jgi:hypothetical protein
VLPEGACLLSAMDLAACQSLRVPDGISKDFMSVGIFHTGSSEKATTGGGLTWKRLLQYKVLFRDWRSLTNNASWTGETWKMQANLNGTGGPGCKVGQGPEGVAQEADKNRHDGRTRIEEYQYASCRGP